VSSPQQKRHGRGQFRYPLKAAVVVTAALLALVILVEVVG